MSPESNDSRKLPWIVMVLFLALTVLATAYVWRMSRLADRARFNRAVDAARYAITSRLDAYTNVLTSTAAVIAVDPTTSRDQLRRYIRTLEVLERHPGIQGVGLTLRLEPDARKQLVDQLHKEGITEFRICPEDARSEVHAIVFLEPLDRRNRAALGYDMFTERKRNLAMSRARDTGRPAASSHVILVQEIIGEKQPGFLLYVPVYRTAVTPATVEARRAALHGFVYAPFRIHDLFDASLQSQRRREVAVELLEGEERLYASEPAVENPRLAVTETLSVAGMEWKVRYTTLRSGGAPQLFAAITFAGGVVISILLSLLLSVQLRAREQAERTAEDLRLSQAELERANRAKDDFLATLSHELRTPMTAIVGWSQLLDTEDVDSELFDTAIDAIRKSSRMQAQLIDDLLDVSRISSGKMHIETHPVELAPIVAAAIDTVASAADAKRLSIARKLEEGIIVNGDARRLQQIVWNLLTNSVKFTPEAGEISVSLYCQDREAFIEVADNGQGIDPAMIEQMFERFRQADSSTTRAHMGLGLGLSIVRHLVELHGGRVGAESPGLGHGAVFRVQLPVLRRREERSAAQESVAVDATALGRARVLVIDDDEEVRNFVSAVFRGSVRELQVASSAGQALEILADWTPDAIVTDLAMPELDGYGLLRSIRNGDERLRKVPVVALTAFVDPREKQRAETEGFDAFVAKPVEPAVLRSVVAGTLAP
ncbi:MAG: CHASE domain-containing protein [Thermoanaerobaculia bacterium]